MWPATPPTMAPLMQPLASAGLVATEPSDTATQAQARSVFILSSDYQPRCNKPNNAYLVPKGRGLPTPTWQSASWDFYYGLSERARSISIKINPVNVAPMPKCRTMLPTNSASVAPGSKQIGRDAK